MHAASEVRERPKDSLVSGRNSLKKRRVANTRSRAFLSSRVPDDPAVLNIEIEAPSPSEVVVS
jgi:hypothetical protein